MAPTAGGEEEAVERESLTAPREAHAASSMQLRPRPRSRRRPRDAAAEWPLPGSHDRVGTGLAILVPGAQLSRRSTTVARTTALRREHR